MSYLEKHSNGQIPLSTCISILKAWTTRFREGYLIRQTFFEPFPDELMEVEMAEAEAGKKDYWKQWR